MKKLSGQRAATLMALAGAAALAGCAGTKGGDSSGWLVYECAQGKPFSVRFINDTAVLKGARGDEVLLRDAGGQGEQTVFTNPHLRAEFGFGTDGREATLYYQHPPLMVRCQRD